MRQLMSSRTGYTVLIALTVACIIVDTVVVAWHGHALYGYASAIADYLWTGWRAVWHVIDTVWTAVRHTLTIHAQVSMHGAHVSLFGGRFGIGAYGSWVPFASPNGGRYVELFGRTYGLELWGHPGVFTELSGPYPGQA